MAYNAPVGGALVCFCCHNL